MNIPKYWADARLESTKKGRPIVVRRSGWSDESVEDARRHAEERASAAMALRLEGGSAPAIEGHSEYGGDGELPIREEVVEHVDGAVITRNGYGARCLNVEDVLFVDIDFEREFPTRPWITLLAVLAGVAVAAVVGFADGVSLALLFGAISAGAVALVADRIDHRTGLTERRVERAARARIAEVVREDPTLRIRVYRTPAGFRLLAMHRTYDPTSDDTLRLLGAFRADPAFVRLCNRQRCFRARLDAKPWRIGIREPMKPRHGKWPLESESEHQMRARWVAAYEPVALGYASCRYEETLGSGATDPRAARIQAIHDEYCRATSSLPIA